MRHPRRRNLRSGVVLLGLVAGAGAGLVAGLALWPAPAPAAGRVTPPVAFTWDRFAPTGHGISIYKPTTLKLGPRKAHPRGFKVFGGREPQTGTQFTLYVVPGRKTQAQLEQDLYGLTGQPAKAWLAVLARGATQGFAWQRALYRQTPAQKTQSALLLAHGSRPEAYIVLVEVDLTVATRHMKMFSKAYQGMRAVP